MKELEMPTPCQQCGEIFELHDGNTSHKWFPNTIICEDCGFKEDEEIEKDNKIDELKERIDSLVDEIDGCRMELIELGLELPFRISTPHY